MVAEVNIANFQTEVLNSARVLVCFGAQWWMPCKMIAPSLEKIAAKLAGKVKVVKFDVDESHEFARQYDVSSVATLVMFKGGEVVDIYVGDGSVHSWISKMVRTNEGHKMNITIPKEHPMAIMNVDTANFPKEVLKSAEPVIVEFWAYGCRPSERMARSLKEIAPELAGTVKIVKLNANENPELAAQYGARAFPTLAIFKGGELAGIFVGAIPTTELRSWISKMVQTTKETR
ncbi:thiol reductase thioredoxin [Sinorhizobium meliloti]|nr:thiol reductase thioredoxin [Sinorhizobium meliloti]